MLKLFLKLSKFTLDWKPVFDVNEKLGSYWNIIPGQF